VIFREIVLNCRQTVGVDFPQKN